MRRVGAIGVSFARIILRRCGGKKRRRKLHRGDNSISRWHDVTEDRGKFEGRADGGSLSMPQNSGMKVESSRLGSAESTGLVKPGRSWGIECKQRRNSGGNYLVEYNVTSLLLYYP
ncbi:hypothetical protein KM043_014766 [Ampulex compressa]|nr:hypothetical protein KM043_014766 [Ampulex compressa]